MERQRPPWWHFFVVYAVINALAWIVGQVLRAAFGDETVDSAIQVLSVPAIVFAIVFAFAFFAYVTWKDVEQPPQRH